MNCFTNLDRESPKPFLELKSPTSMWKSIDIACFERYNRSTEAPMLELKPFDTLSKEKHLVGELHVTDEEAGRAVPYH